MLAYISENDMLQSLLYDLDLLPEQLTEGSKEWRSMCLIAIHFKSAETPLRDENARLKGLVERLQGALTTIADGIDEDDTGLTLRTVQKYARSIK
jgi:hypothetical protein